MLRSLNLLPPILLGAIFSAVIPVAAAPPVFRTMPDLCIGDLEDSPSAQDNNFFRYRYAFEFDQYVEDPDTPASQLLWSFDESSGFDLDGNPGNVGQFFRVNGKEPVHVEDELFADPNPESHLSPGPAHELRSVGPRATIRDIVLSPPPGTVYPEPSPSLLDQHTTGKLVTFWVSDGTDVTSQTIVVAVCDDQPDAATGGFLPITPDVQNTFTSPTGWAPTRGNSSFASSEMSTAHDVANGELDATVGPNQTSPQDPNFASYNRIIGWMEGNERDDHLDSQHLSYGEAGTNFVRASYAVYATIGTPDLNRVPNLRLRITSRFAFAAVLDVLHHQYYDPSNNPISDDLTPTTNPLAPSIYRVDLDPPEELPFVQANPTEGLQRMWEAFSPGYEPLQQGTINLTESSIGTYPPLDLSGSSNLVKTYSGADFAQSNIYYVLQRFARSGNVALEGTHYNTQSPTLGTSISAEIRVVGSDSNVVLSTADVSDNKIGIAALDFITGTIADGSDHRIRVRAEAGKLYAVSFRVTSTTPATQAAWYRFRARSAKFGWSARLELNGAWHQAMGYSVFPSDRTRPGHLLAQQFAPGTTPRIYTVLSHSPIDSDIGLQPQLNAEDGPGEGPQSRPQPSRRDFYPGADVIDSISGSYWSFAPDFGEKGHLVIDRIEIRAFDNPSLGW